MADPFSKSLQPGGVVAQKGRQRKEFTAERGRPGTKLGKRGGSSAPKKGREEKENKKKKKKTGKKEGSPPKSTTKKGGGVTKGKIKGTRLLVVVPWGQ